MIRYYDSGIMSDTHWTIRIIVFGFLTWVFKEIFRLINWICSFQWWIYLITVLVIILIIIVASIFKHKISQKRFETAKITADNNYIKSKLPPKPTETNQVRNSRDLCPRCGNVLVKRIGPYGSFWGCGSFPKCRYTRSFY